ncbi:MAG: F0F1 ATP synthase subunit A [Alphaproteobacteria bacterium]|nr:F0F1 ATP synthase subunit A [Alphaproteobacteria bacterium]
MSTAHAAASKGEAHGPLEQFEIHRLVEVRLGSLDLSFTNSSLWMVIVAALITLFLTAAMHRSAMVPGRLQLMAELAYQFVARMVRDNAGTAGRPYFPFIFTLFMFILFCNLQGLVPYTFTVTSHIIITFAFAIFIFLGVTVIGFVKHGPKFLTLFVPSGAPIVILPLLVVIELISYLIRPITLSVRLFANMMAGHTLLKVFGSFVVMLGGFYVVPGVAPLALTVAMYALEFLVAVLQAYVFAVLSCVYLNDALHLHH